MEPREDLSTLEKEIFINKVIIKKYSKATFVHDTFIGMLLSYFFFLLWSTYLIRIFYATIIFIFPTLFLVNLLLFWVFKFCSEPNEEKNKLKRELYARWRTKQHYPPHWSLQHYNLPQLVRVTKNDQPPYNTLAAPTLTPI